MCELAALAPAEVRPAFSTTIGFFLRHPFGDFRERAAVFQILAMLRDDLGVVVLFEEGQEIVLVDIGLVAETDDRRDAILAEREKPMIAMPMPPDCDDSAAEPLTS